MVSPKSCRHKNIQWEDFFKPEKQNNYQYNFRKAYCLECSTDKGREFAFNCQLWYKKKIDEWLDEQKQKIIENEKLKKNDILGLYDYLYGSNSSIDDFIKKDYPDLEQHWQKFKNGRIDEEYFEGILGQGLFFEMSRSIEKIYLEFILRIEQQINNNPNKEQEPSDSNLPVPKPHKHKDNSDSNTEREREREREQIQQSISNLENKPNKTTEEEQELEDKKKQLEQLDNDTDVPAKANANEPFNWTPWIIGGLVLVAVIGIGFYLISKKGKDKYAV